jgi:uncharacterized membrane protein YeiH
MRSGNLYASAAIAGATTWVWARWFGATLPAASLGGALVVVGLRLAAIIYDLRLPVYHLDHPEGP